MLEDLKKELTREIKKDTASILARIEETKAQETEAVKKKEEPATPPQAKISLKINGEITEWEIMDIQQLLQEIIEDRVKRNYPALSAERLKYNKCNNYGKIILLLTSENNLFLIFF
jgi:hypothetical protein